MAIQTDFQTTQNIQLVIGHEDNVGNGALLSGQAWYKLPIIAPPTINDNQTAMDFGTLQSGSYIQPENSTGRRNDQAMWEISFSVIADNTLPTLFQYMTHDLSGTQATLGEDYAPANWTDNNQNVTAGKETAVIYIVNAIKSGSNVEWKYSGCVLKSIELTHSIDSNAGLPIINCTFVTGYPAELKNDVAGLTITSGVNVAGRKFTDIVTTNRILGLSTATDGDVRVYSHSISMSRDIQRVGYQDTTNYKPYSYEQVGELECTGSITFKKDSHFPTIQALSRNNDNTGFNMVLAPNYFANLNKAKMTNLITDTGSAELRATAEFKGIGDPEGSSSVALIKHQ